MPGRPRRKESSRSTGIYNIYAESFKGQEHLDAITSDAKKIAAGV